jgi:hypothetical protein
MREAPRAARMLERLGVTRFLAPVVRVGEAQGALPVLRLPVGHTVLIRPTL